jgi:serine phosphatase RsbU (regulator of sigma subunit)
VRDALPDPDAMQAALVEWLGTALRADRCLLTVVDAAHDAFTIGRDYRSDDAALLSLAGTYRLSDFTDDLNALYGSSMSDSGPSLMVFNDTQSALNNDVPLERRTAAAIAGLGLRSVVNVAVYEGSMLVAALGVGMAFAPRDWTAHEVQLIADMAVQARAAVEAARLQKRERNIAQTLQATLQPPAPDDLPGLALDGVYLPALAEAGVGGDFYDVFPVEKGCTALVVSDLSGKGLAAASEVATVRNMVRYAIYSGHTLAEAMADLDRILVEHRLLTGFATLFVGLYDQNERTVTYVNCGQEPALIWQAETGEVEMLPPTAPVLGSFAAGNGFTEASVALTVGDVFAAFTDGLTDVGPNRRHLLDVDGVADLLRDCCIDLRSGNPRSIVNCLMVGVHAFGQGVAASDDIALLVGVVGGGGIANKEGGIPGDQA